MIFGNRRREAPVVETPQPETGTIRFEGERRPATHPKACALLAYCEGKRSGGELLSRDSIEPRDILPLLPHLFVVEPFDGDWRYRLYGTGLQARFHVEMTWKRFGEIYESKTAGDLNRVCEDATRSGTPAAMRGVYRGAGFEDVGIEAVQIPMLARDGRTRHVLGGLFFLD